MISWTMSELQTPIREFLLQRKEVRCPKSLCVQCVCVCVSVWQRLPSVCVCVCACVPVSVCVCGLTVPSSEALPGHVRADRHGKHRTLPHHKVPCTQSVRAPLCVSVCVWRYECCDKVYV